MSVLSPVFVQIRSVLLPRVTCHFLSSRGLCLLPGRVCHTVQPHSPLPARHACRRPLLPPKTALAGFSDVSTHTYSLIYTFPHIKLLRAVSRLKLLQTGITMVLLPPVYVLYLLGDAPFFLVSYTTGIAVFAGAMLYTASHFFRRVVGMMYLDPPQTTIKVSHLTFWGRRRDIYIPVSDVLTIGDTGDSSNETILKLKRYSTAETLYFSTHFGRVVDKPCFEKVFGSLS